MFTDESFPPALFLKLPPMMVERELDIYWTTLIRFESQLLEPETWDMAYKAGCRSLYYGLESANERIIKLVKKDTDIEAAKINLEQAKRVGIWSHVMCFYGFQAKPKPKPKIREIFSLKINTASRPSRCISLFFIKTHR